MGVAEEQADSLFSASIVMVPIMAFVHGPDDTMAHRHLYANFRAMAIGTMIHDMVPVAVLRIYANLNL